MAAELYQYVYLFVCSILLLNALNYAKLPSSSDGLVAKSKTSIGTIIFISILVLWIGLRPHSFVFSDTMAYIEIYQITTDKAFEFNLNTENLVFDNLMSYCGNNDYAIETFFIIIAAIYFGCIYVSSKKLFPQNTAIAFYSYLVAFSTFSYATNGIKAGAGAAVFLLALAYRKNLIVFVLLSLLSIGFHHSMKVVIYAYIVVFLYKNTKIYFCIWIAAFFIAALHISYFQELFASYTDKRGAGYLLVNNGVNYVTGFRLDFILYGAAPILVGYIYCIKRELKDNTYELMLRLYTLLNSVWMLCMYASFTNRIAYLSWFLYPYVLLYPFYQLYYSNSQLNVGRNIVVLHLCFTLFMTMIFYPLLKSIVG